MNSQRITNHEEILDAVRGGADSVKRLAKCLAVSESTARRYADELVDRGWLVRRRASEDRGRRTVRYIAYWLTARGSEAYRTGEAF